MEQSLYLPRIKCLVQPHSDTSEDISTKNTVKDLSLPL